MEFYPELVSRYENMLLNNEPFYFDGFNNTEVLLWMINEIRKETGETMESLVHKERFLAYVQQAVISAGFTDVTTELGYFKGMFIID